MITLYVGECPMRYMCLIGLFCCASASILFEQILIFCEFIVDNLLNIGLNLKNWANVVILCVVFL